MNTPTEYANRAQDALTTSHQATMDTDRQHAIARAQVHATLALAAAVAGATAEDLER